MSVEQPGTITVPPATMHSKLAPLGFPDYSTMNFVSDLPEQASDHVTPPGYYQRGQYPFISDKPGPNYPTPKQLNKKLKTTPKQVPICTDARAKVKIVHTGDLKMAKHGKRKATKKKNQAPSKSKKRRKRNVK